MADFGGGYPQGGMRASDADRERTVDVLKAGFAEGRLGREEYEDRVGRAYRSATYGELDALVWDLPRGPAASPAGLPFGALPAFAPQYLPVPQRPTNSLAVVSLVCGLAGTLLVLPAVPAVVLGHRARAEVRRSGERGENAATAGLVLGYVMLSIWVLVLVILPAW